MISKSPFLDVLSTYSYGNSVRKWNMNHNKTRWGAKTYIVFNNRQKLQKRNNSKRWNEMKMDKDENAITFQMNQFSTIYRKSSWIAMATVPHLFWVPPVEAITMHSVGDDDTANMYCCCCWLLFLSWRDCCRCRLLLKVLLLLLLMWMEDLWGLWMERRRDTTLVSPPPAPTTDEW